nr:GGDEF domain-containing protein [uncultured Roseococcus sp.]
MMFANGGVLGLMIRDLPPALRPAALRWQAGTLVIAIGCALYAFPQLLPVVPLVTLANALFLSGLTLYLRALQRFFRHPPRHVDLLPGIIGTLSVLWFSAIHPDTTIRIIVVSLAWAVLMGRCVHVLRSGKRAEASCSRQMLKTLFLLVAAFTGVRAAYFVAIAIPPDFSVADGRNWMNLVSPMVSAVLPVIGTTAFLLMCSEHIRRQWENAASTDYLTGLANRRTLTEVGGSYFRARSPERQIALALIDVDDFKAINDGFGHDAGDLALKHIAATLEAEITADQLLARTGGEEFVALLGRGDLPSAQLAAERLRSAVQRHPFILRGQRISITVSVGIAVSQADDADFASLLRRADQAMYTAKSLGRNRVELAA